MMINLLPMVAVVALLPIVPNIIGNFKEMPYITTLGPLVLSAPGLCVALFSPYAGHLTDKLGRRNLLLIFTLLYGLGGILPFFMTQFASLMTGRLLLGVGEAFVLTIGNTLLGDYYSTKDRSTWLMIQGIVASICGTLLLSLSGFLSKNYGWQFPFLVYSFAFIITIATYLFIFEPDRKEEIQEAAASNDKFPLPLVLKICLTTLIASSIYFVYTFQFSVVLNSIGITDDQQRGNYMAIASVAVPVGALIFKFVSKYDIKWQITLIACLIGVGMIGIGLSPTIHLVIASAWIQQLGCGMTMAVLIAWALNSLPTQFRGRGMGFWSSAFFIGQFLSPFVVTGMRSLTGSLLNAFVAFGVLCLGLAVINLFINKK